MQITLFEAAAQVREILETQETIDPETGEINAAYLESSDLFNHRAQGCIAWLLEEDAGIEAAEHLLKHMGETLRARKNRYARVHGYMADNMKAAGILEIKGEQGLYKAKLYIDRDESVLLEADAQFPPEYCMEPQPPLPSKTKIKAALKAGQHIEGARIIKRDRLHIK